MNESIANGGSGEPATIGPKLRPVMHFVYAFIVVEIFKTVYAKFVLLVQWPWDEDSIRFMLFDPLRWQAREHLLVALNCFVAFLFLFVVTERLQPETPEAARKSATGYRVIHFVGDVIIAFLLYSTVFLLGRIERPLPFDLASVWMMMLLTQVLMAIRLFLIPDSDGDQKGRAPLRAVGITWCCLAFQVCWLAMLNQRPVFHSRQLLDTVLHANVVIIAVICWPAFFMGRQSRASGWLRLPLWVTASLTFLLAAGVLVAPNLVFENVLSAARVYNPFGVILFVVGVVMVTIVALLNVQNELPPLRLLPLRGAPGDGSDVWVHAPAALQAIVLVLLVGMLLYFHATGGFGWLSAGTIFVIAGLVSVAIQLSGSPKEERMH